MMGVKQAAGAGLMGLAMFGIWGLGAVLHVWTILLAFMVSGLFAAVLTLMFPVLSEAYWFFKVMVNAGVSHPYCLSVLAYLAFFVIAMVGGLLASSDA